MSVVIDRHDGWEWLAFDRPAVRNALDHEMLDQVQAALARQPRMLVLASTSQAFCAGADLGLTDDARAALSDRLYEVFATMRTSPTIVVACANGAAVGGGAQLLVASDIRVIGPGFWCRFVGPGHGLVIGAWALPTLVGRGRAMAWLLEQSRIDAQTALTSGLVDVHSEDPEARTRQLVDTVMGLEPAVVAQLKRVVGEPDPLEGLAAERDGNHGWSGAIPRD